MPLVRLLRRRRPWRGRRAFVVGGGPSAGRLDLARLAGERVVACNDAALALPHAPSIHLAVDWPYWRDHAPREGSVGVAVELGLGSLPSNLRALASIHCTTGEDHWGHRWGRSWADGVMVGGQSGIAAANLAWLLGASPIYLVGIDLGGGPDRWHGGAGGEAPWERFREAWELVGRVGPDLVQLGDADVAGIPRGEWPW